MGVLLFFFSIRSSKFNIAPLYSSAALLLGLPFLQPSTAQCWNSLSQGTPQVTGTSPGHSASRVTEGPPSLMELLV